ncbi:major facilitator superfamily domain-containing protein [Aspergillus alliaceus]|uniref:Major facilitator superfamily domain-containing protein n=1 Tax=Petromyces alliaceus TaxID=209559 RepID=A0A5N7C5V1_PETAA|nr:major facilitator superfamily domain-containing protein [Aspergillus alliaceus]
MFERLIPWLLLTFKGTIESGTVCVFAGRRSDPAGKDPIHPRDWGFAKRLMVTIVVSFMGVIVGWSSSIDSGVIPQYAEELGVSEVVASLSTGLFLVGFGTGAVISGPFSETVGRNPVYIITLVMFMLSLVGAGSTSDLGGQLVCRTLAGIFAATPLSCARGTVADAWMPEEQVFAFPIIAIISFFGPVLGPVVGGWIGQSGITWRWTEWVTLIGAGIVLVTVLRQASLSARLMLAMYRPVVMLVQEPIIFLFSLYLTVAYIIISTSFTGYEFMYKDIYGFSQGETALCFLGLAIGLLCCAFLIPHNAKLHARDMAWTARSDISFWSPLSASVLTGFGMLCDFITCYQYLIDTYEAYAASALSCLTLMRYLVSGAMIEVSIPVYKDLGVPHRLTILGCINAVLVHVPYVSYRYGPWIRKRSKYGKIAGLIFD